MVTIIDLILWFRDNAAQIAELVGTIASMAMAVLQGQVAALAGAVNSVLKRILPLVLGFVGALVGIGGVVRKIQKIFKAIGKPARKAIRKLFVKFKKLVQKLLKKLKGKGKKKKKLSPRKVLGVIVSALKKPPKETDPAKAISEKKSQAAKLEKEYQPRLKKGRIRIKLDTSVAGATKDSDIDFTVSVNPTQTSQAPINATLQKKFKAEIDRSHQAAVDDISTGVGNIPKSKANIQNWATIRTEIEARAPVNKIVARPVDARLKFGQAVSGLVDQGVMGADNTASASKISKVKAAVNAGTGFYAEPKQLFVAHVYNRAASTTQIVKSVTNAVTEASKTAPLEPYDRTKHYGHTPSKADRTHFGAGPNDVVDHDPPLVQRYYQGAPGEKPGFQQSPAERKASGSNRSRMALQPRDESNKQGAEMSQFSVQQKKKFGL